MWSGLSSLLLRDLGTIARDDSEELTSLLPRILVGKHRHPCGLGGLLVEAEVAIDLIGNT